MKISSREIAIIGLMLALALALDVMPVEMPTVWGMKIDLVAVPIVVAYFILGFWGGLTALAMLFLGLSVVSSASWLGAMMKTLATFGVLVGLEVAVRTVGVDYSSKKKLALFGVVAYVIGILVRAPLMVALNYYVALPIWLSLPREQVISAVENWTGVPFWFAITLPNAIQTFIDVFISLLVTVPVLRRIPHLLE
ncbi:ECF transporter S component [Thermococcus stetteri]|uniref:ECF transporter S component n=1 Tax=Thermococcus stetteri TaxID=49900 RepID=UPI001AE65B00|nr:ECF transporter S component [Thermococcus stetteri]